MSAVRGLGWPMLAHTQSPSASYPATRPKSRPTRERKLKAPNTTQRSERIRPTPAQRSPWKETCPHAAPHRGQATACPGSRILQLC
eukprot:3512833-Pyramimonas_sp.AAC.1